MPKYFKLTGRRLTKIKNIDPKGQSWSLMKFSRYLHTVTREKLEDAASIEYALDISLQSSKLNLNTHILFLLVNKLSQCITNKDSIHLSPVQVIN